MQFSPTAAAGNANELDHSNELNSESDDNELVESTTEAQACVADESAETDSVDADEDSSSPAISPGPDVILSLNIGGTGFEAGLMSMRGELIDRSYRAVEPDVGPQSHFAAVAAVVTEQMQAAEKHRVVPRAVGIGATGPITRHCESVSPIALPAWREFPLRRHIAKLTNLPVYGDLDAKALALSEGWLGAAKGYNNFCAISVSASIGGGLVIDGELIDGAGGNAGHVGHIIVEPGGRRCGCGARGCLDAVASGLAIETITGRSTSEPTYEIMRRTGILVGRAAGMVCTSLDLPLVVIGGTVAEGFAATFINAAQQELDRVAKVSVGAAPRIAAARLGDRGVLIGAGAVGLRGLRRG